MWHYIDHYFYLVIQVQYMIRPGVVTLSSLEYDSYYKTELTVSDIIFLNHYH